MQPSLLPIAILATAAWVVAFVTILVATRPRISPQAPPGGDWAEVPPAIVALLCSRDGRVGEQAVSATFLDLVARRLLKRSVTASGQAQVEPAGADDSALKSYERQMLDHVSARARHGGGMALEGALRLESSEHAARWMKDFSDKVIADARQRGLVEERVSLRVCFWLWLSLMASLALLAVAAIGIFAVIAFIVSAPVVTLLRGERRTEAGSRLVPMYQALAARRASEPANSSRQIDRKDAYAAALGAGGSARSPFAHQDGHRVWSRSSGQWREVRIVKMPSVFQGSDPVAALYVIPSALIFFGIWARLLFGFTVQPQRWSILAIVLAAGWLIFAVLNFFVWRFVYRGLYDLRAGPVEVMGQVLYLDVRTSPGEEPGKVYHVAIDDGRKGKAIKHEIDKELFEQLRFGDWLRLEVTPKLRCVRSTSVIPAPSSL